MINLYNHLYDFMASDWRFSMNFWKVGNEEKLSWNEGGRENGRVGLQFAVFVVRRVNSALNKINMNFFSRCFFGCDILADDELMFKYFTISLQLFAWLFLCWAVDFYFFPFRFIGWLNLINYQEPLVKL